MTPRRRVLAGLAATPLVLGCSRGDAADATRRVQLSELGGSPAAPDNAGALKNALAALAAQGGGVLEVGAGDFRIASRAIGQRGITLPANVTIRGAGRARTRLIVTGREACNLFASINSGSVAIEDLTLLGNGAAVQPGYGNGSAIRWMLDASADRDVAGFTLRRVHLDNFGGNYWVDIENDAPADARIEMRDLAIEDVTFTSRPGNSLGPDQVAQNSSAISINGFSGAIRTIRISGLNGDARHIKSGLILYHRILDAAIDRPVIDNAGIDGASDDAGAYALQFYDPTGTMSGITVTRPVLAAPRSVGIYVAGGSGVTIIEPSIHGQTDRQSGTLPKGAIVFNGTRRWSVTGGKLSSNWCDIAIAAPAGGTRDKPVRIDGTLTGITGERSSRGIAIGYFAGSIARGLVVRDCVWRTSQTCVTIQNSDRPVVSGPSPSGGYIGAIRFERCRLDAGTGFRAIDLWVGSGSPAGEYTVRDCVLSGSNPLYARGLTGTLEIAGTRIADHGDTSGAAAATLIDCPQLKLSDCTVISPGRGGIGLNLAGSAGAVRGVRFERCASTLAPTSFQLGANRPTFEGQAGQFVQNLRLGAGEGDGWVCEGGTRWREA